MRVSSFKNLPTSTLSFLHLQSPLFMKQHQYLRKLRTVKFFRVVETSRQNRVVLTSRYNNHVHLFISTDFPSSVSLTSFVFFSPNSGALKVQNSIEMLKYLFYHQLFPKLILGTFIYSHTQPRRVGPGMLYAKRVIPTTSVLVDVLRIILILAGSKNTQEHVGDRVVGSAR